MGRNEGPRYRVTETFTRAVRIPPLRIFGTVVPELVTEHRYLKGEMLEFFIEADALRFIKHYAASSYLERVN